MTKDYKKTYVGNGKYKPSHIVIMENELGRPLQENEVVHHINGNKRDNDPINLVVLTREEHHDIHRELDKMNYEMQNANSILFLYCDCGMAIRDVAKELGLGKNAVNRVLNKYGAIRSPKSKGELN